ncbi:MAG: cytochrome C biogenesis protein CcmF [Hirschia sp.]|nr:cytochrome C biogenesis protein CcmF [Hirschia sp.]MBF19316.1 cytochrome C biogenesis protein CcmF [Hirschia sp.]
MGLSAVAAIFGLVALVMAFIRSDFSVELVARHSHSLKPFFYKIAGAWGNHEGSMLLWCVIMLGYGAIAGAVMAPGRLKARALGVQGALAALSLAYLLFASSPFTRLADPPLDGNGLNPLLQDPALAFHPPFLYLGYVGFSFVFSIAAAGLIEGQVGREWARRVRPWALFAWSALTIGISLGAIWAYYELGWGGWWFWDPVENASFMPWLVGAALVHSLIVTQKRGSMAAWTVLLAVLTFCLSILGAFLVRSGVLTSVHAFALDPERGALLLAGLVIVGVFALGLYAWRAPKLEAGPVFDPISREGALILNNLFLSVAAATVLVGTLYPLVVEAVSGEKISVGSPYFDMTLAPLMAILFLAPPAAQSFAWRKADLTPVLKRLIIAGALAIAAAGATFILLAGKLWAVLGVAIGVWLIAGTITDLLRRIGGGGVARAFALSASIWGMTIAHIGLGVFVIGASVEVNGRVERTFALMPGETAELDNWTFTFNGVQSDEGPNYFSQVADITAVKGRREMQLAPQKRFYPAAGMPTTEVAIRKSLTGDLYVALGDEVRGRPGAWTLRVSFNPMIDWVFGGAGLIALGGFMAFASKRLRQRVEVDDPITVEPDLVAEPAE